MSGSWKMSLRCTRAEAEALEDDISLLALLDPTPTLVTREIVEFDDENWALEAYFDREPDADTVRVIHALIPSAAGIEPVIEELPEDDWLTLSQQGIEPVVAGRFYVHTSANKGKMPKSSTPFLIEASQAFGTGGHETTHGCLEMLDGMKRHGARFENLVDIGTGTGLLAFAARHLWPRAYVTASDIDPLSVDVTALNADVNGVPLGQFPGQVALCAAPGTDHEMIQRRAPYDLVIANILAGPLIELAPSLTEILRPGGSLILAGLLHTQVDNVVAAYRAQGVRLAERRDRGDWPCLRLVRRQRYGWQRPVRASGRTSQPPGDYGTW